MQINKLTIQTLFSAREQYVVPSFQRRYVWEKERQWAPLWQDVADKATEIAERGIGTSIVPHFLGALVLKQERTPVGEPTRRLVVDGQQRLTTLQVMIIAIADALKELRRYKGIDAPTSSRLERALRQSVSNDDAFGDSRYKVRPFADHTFDVLKQLVKGSPSSCDHVLASCHAFFQEYALGWLRAEPDNEVPRAEALVTALLQSFTVVGLNLDKEEDEYVIFEALNARGTPLTEWEKSKNHLLSKSRQTPMGEDAFYNKYIDHFDRDEWWNQIVSLPRFSGSRSELLLNYWLTIRLRRGVDASRAYYDFRGIVKEQEDLSQMTDSLCEHARIFRELTTQPEDHTPLGLFRYRIDVLGITVVMPLMMELARLLETDHRFRQCCTAIESYLVRRQLVWWSTRNYRALFIDLLKKVHDTDEPVRVVFDGLSEGWPSNDQVRNAVLYNPASPGTAAKRIRMVLEAVEDHRISPTMAAIRTAPRGLWIEHILPQKWEANWPLPPDADDRDRDRREQILKTLGNLTLTTSQLDISLSNRSWQDKRETLKKHNNLYLNKDILDHHWGQWNETAIEKRGQCLAEIICKVWPDEAELREKCGLADGTGPASY